MPNILDPKFRYVPAAQTDIRRTFARVRRELKEREAAERARRETVAEHVTPLEADMRSRELPGRIASTSNGVTQFTPRRRQA